MPLSSPTIPIAQRDIFLPIIRKDGDPPVEPPVIVVPPVEPPIVIPPPALFIPNLEEEELGDLLRSSPFQQRKSMIWNPIVAKVARDRCLDMAARDYFAHTNPDGVGPNCLVCLAGFQTPEFYVDARDANYIESIGAGYSRPLGAFEGLMSSPGHRTHIMGEIDFYEAQNYFGVGFVTVVDSKWKHYCSIIFTEAG